MKINQNPGRECPEIKPVPAGNERVDEVNEKIRLIQKTDGLTFGTDAYLLAAFAPVMKNAVAADLGSGTGIIPLLLLAREKVARIHAFEIQPEFADLIRRNAEENGVADRLIPHLADVRDISSRDTGGALDAVFANPPYRRAGTGIVSSGDAKRMARHAVMGDIGDFCLAASRLLRSGGKFFVVFRPDRLADLTVALRDARLEPKRMTFVHADADAEPSMVLVEARRDGAPEVRITPPLFLTEKLPGGERPMSARAQRIYDTCSFD